MSVEPFKPSLPLTIGVELELQLVNLSDFDLIAASPDMLELLKRKLFPGTVTPEITESMIEIATDVHTEYSTLLAQLSEMRNVLIHTTELLNLGICGGGTHPFQVWSEQRIFSKSRFQKVSALYGYLAQQFTVFGQHIHIGCRSGDEALFLLHALNRYVPHFIALSASSPFIQGQDTLFHSARLNSVFAFPLSGRAPFILKWDQFENEYFNKMVQTGVVNSMKDFYWDIRPKPEFGTVELRVCDTPLSVERAAALACYLQALCRYLLQRHEPDPIEDDYLVYNYNRFQACRFGLNGILVHPKTYEQISVNEDIAATLDRLRSHCGTLLSGTALENITQIINEGCDASYLRNQYEEVGSLEGVVNSSLRRFKSSKFNRVCS